MIGEEALAGLAGAIQFWEHPPAGYLDLIRTGILGNPDLTITHAKIFRDGCLQMLRVAEPFWVSPTITETLVMAASTLPSVALTPAHLPVPSGWIWFASGIVDDEITKDPARIHGLHWFDRIDGGIEVHIYLATAYGLGCGGRINVRYAEPVAAERDTPTSLLTRFARILAAFFLFVQQDIFGLPEQRIGNKGARRRLATALDRDDPMFRVVELRRAQSEPSGERHTVEWRHQWLVSGHWRRQWLPSRQTHEPRWIAPYVKGDPSKPLKPPAKRLFVVRR